MKHHTARLIALTQPTEEIVKELGVNSPEGLTTYIARVSNPENQSNSKIENLLKHCYDHGHWSVFEQVYATVEIITTRDVSAQILRHRSFVFQEFSQRYSDVNSFEEMYELPELHIQDRKNRQKSYTIDQAIETGYCEPSTAQFAQEITEEIKEALEQVKDIYNRLLSKGIAKESARRILPIATTTKIYMTGNLRSFIFYLKSRNSKTGSAQIEHQMVADSIEKIFKENFPIVFSSF